MDLDLLLNRDAQIKPKQGEWENLQAQRNTLSRDIAKASPDQRAAMKDQVAGIKLKMDVIENDLKGLKAQFKIIFNSR